MTTVRLQEDETANPSGHPALALRSVSQPPRQFRAGSARLLPGHSLQGHARVVWPLLGGWVAAAGGVSPCLLCFVLQSASLWPSQPSCVHRSE